MIRELTNRAIKETFIQMCLERPIEKITVQDIAERCGISKQTFYNHFRDKQDLMNYVYDEEVKRAVDTFCSDDRGTAAMRRAISSVLNRCRELQGYYSSLVRYQTQNSFSEFFFETARLYFENSAAPAAANRGIDAHQPGSSSRLDRVIGFACAGLNWIMVDWIRRGMVEEVETIADEMIACLPEELCDVLNKKV
ncbi:MAG: TetR family transcriptional regulator [Coriobacteriales bacterium]